MLSEKRLFAFLDSYNQIKIYQSKNFYNGKSENFYLRDEHGKLEALQIQSVSSYSEGYVCYEIKVSQSLVIGKVYTIIHEYAGSCTLQYRFITKTEQFDEEFYYAGTDLGCTYSPEESEFVVWAPTANQVLVQLEKEQQSQIIPMVREDKGIFRIKVSGDYQSATYLYHAHVNGEWVSSIDPYGKSATANATKSAVINPERIQVDQNDKFLPTLLHKTESILYETSVRDFSASKEIDFKYPKQYIGMIEEGLKTKEHKSAGIDYVKELGITHIQLMPVNDFETIDEMNPNQFYNWGYDPISFYMAEGSYSSDPTDPYSRVIELKQVIANYHKQGIRVTLDMVFNHVYEVYQSAFQKLVPYYYFRYTDTGHLSNGSFCDCDLASERKMTRKHIIDTLTHWVVEYGVDGFRFDLMGILDVDTMNETQAVLSLIKPDILLYGEGWNMPTILPDEQKATIANQSKMTEIGHFNDFYRDHVKGPTAADQIKVKGYLAGDTNYIDAMMSALVANTLSDGFVKIYNQPHNSINYVECHDNHTVWDKLKECCKEDNREKRIKKQKLMLGALCVSQGITFIHSGQEFCRTKNGIGNSYVSGDSINHLDWDRKDRYYEVVQYTRDLIQIRKDLKVFSFPTTEEIQQHVSFEKKYDGVLFYKLNDIEEYGNYSRIEVIFNPTDNVIYHEFEEEMELLANENGKIGDLKNTNITITPFSMSIVGQKR